MNEIVIEGRNLHLALWCPKSTVLASCFDLPPLLHLQRPGYNK